MGTRTFVKQRQPSLMERVQAGNNGDAPLLLTLITLLVFGLLMLYSSSLDYSSQIMGKEPTYLFKRQLLWLALGVVIAYLISRFDYHHWKRLVVLAMIFTVATLISVLMMDQIRLGAVRSFYEGSIQPSELAKLVTVIYLSVWLYAKRGQLHDISLGLIPLGIILGLVGGLIGLQPDISAAATIIILGGMLFFLAGADLRQIIILMVLAV
ncbi:MAG: FtsW/RodA/SpoVE family cell cycle protein, partial [Anaerolineales bacterium]|nr:FtsW/RodA/SpoVE family cell cycle protein [Anaerolineales bacterium]